MIVANTGSVSLSYDGDRRAAYLLLDNLRPAIRRVDYNVDCGLKLFPVAASRIPIGLRRSSQAPVPDAITIAPAHVTQVKGFSKC